jgi:hypothetical protein
MAGIQVSGGNRHLSKRAQQKGAKQLSPLVAYYVFLVAVAVLTAALRNSVLVSGNRNRYLSNLIVAPLVLIAAIAQSMSRWTGGLVVLVIIVVGRLLVRGPDKPVMPATVRWSLIFWAIEAIVPLSLHFALRLPDRPERILLLATGSALFMLFLLTFYVFAPDLRKQRA